MLAVFNLLLDLFELQFDKAFKISNSIKLNMLIILLGERSCHSKDIFLMTLAKDEWQILLDLVVLIIHLAFLLIDGCKLDLNSFIVCL